MLRAIPRHMLTQIRTQRSHGDLIHVKPMGRAFTDIRPGRNLRLSSSNRKPARTGHFFSEARQMNRVVRRFPRWQWLGIVAALASSFSAGCTYYGVAPGYYGTSPASAFDRSWYAAVGAMADEGVAITTEDRNAGIVRGVRNGINVTGNVRVQADGSVRVEFNTSGSTSRDPSLIDRISRAYERRMGR